MVLTGLGVKPLYTMLALLLVVVLWRHGSPDLAALRWAIICSSSARIAVRRTT